jgi:tight adherence protein C
MGSQFGSAELLLLGGLVMAAYAVYSFVYGLLSNQSDSQILSWASNSEPEKSKSGLINASRPLVHQFSLKYALRIKNERYRTRIQRLLLTAGMSRTLNVDEFIGLQILWGLMIPVFILVMNFALEMGIAPSLLLLLGCFGGYAPIMQAQREKRIREMSVRADLPFFADLLALSTEAGLDFISAIQRIFEKADSSVLADEFGVVLKDIKLGASRADSLKAMSSRLDIPEITSFVAVLVDADATGASISQVLKDQSTQIRLERFVRAEKAGARASQAIMIPMMLFILPAVFIIIFGPVVLQFFYGGKG